MVKATEKKMKQNTRICVSASNLKIDGLTTCSASRARCSSAIAALSVVCSEVVSHLASWICDCSQKYTNPHRATEAPPSIRNIHCQPCRPSPVTLSKAPVIGPEMIEAMAEPLRKIAMALPRSLAGNHWVK